MSFVVLCTKAQNGFCPMLTREVNHHLHAAVDDGDAHERRQKQRDGKRRKIAPTSIAHLMLAQA